ncbi:putative type-1 restriction enzyme specificity protein, partial [Haemophilus influenzae]
GGGGRRNLLMWLKSKMEKIGNILGKVIFQYMVLEELWDMLMHIHTINLQY